MSESSELTVHRGQEVEEAGLVTRESADLATASDTAAAQAEIQSALVLANRFPRSEDAAFQKLMRACKRTTFAQGASYSFPRGGTKVTGPSVNLAREAARVWGNIRYGIEVIRDDAGGRKIRGWAWDLETNTKVAAEDEFQKLIQRKGKNGGATQWVAADERDLRELTNRRGAILVRNCILQLLPYDLIEDAANTAHQTLQEESARDPDGERKRLLAAFDVLNVSAQQLEAYLGHPIKEASPAELADLRQVWKSISDGNSTWSEYAPKEAAPGKEVTVDDLAKKRTKPEPPKEAEAETIDVTPAAKDAPAGEAAVEDVPTTPGKLRDDQLSRIFGALEHRGNSLDDLEDRLDCSIKDVAAADEMKVLKLITELPKPAKGKG